MANNLYVGYVYYMLFTVKTKNCIYFGLFAYFMLIAAVTMVVMMTLMHMHTALLW